MRRAGGREGGREGGEDSLLQVLWLTFSSTYCRLEATFAVGEEKVAEAREEGGRGLAGLAQSGLGTLEGGSYGWGGK